MKADPVDYRKMDAITAFVDRVARTKEEVLT